MLSRSCVSAWLGVCSLSKSSLSSRHTLCVYPAFIGSLGAEALDHFLSNAVNMYVPLSDINRFPRSSMSRSRLSPLPSAAVVRHHSDLRVVINGGFRLDHSLYVSCELRCSIHWVSRATATRLTRAAGTVTLTPLALTSLVPLAPTWSSLEDSSSCQPLCFERPSSASRVELR